jgi:hypothetical protein
MTTYSNKLAELSRAPCTLAVLTLDFCSLTYGVAPCTGALAAGSECYNTFATCQDRTNFARATKDYRFTSHESPLPFSDGERPYIERLKYLPTEIKDEITVKGRVTLEMADEPDTDIGIDPYVATRATVQGNFWKKLLARNPNYKGRPIKIYDGFIGMTEANFLADGKMFAGIVDNIQLGKGIVKIEAADLLKELDQVSIPAKLNIKLASDISAAQTSVTVAGMDMASMDSPTGYIRVDDEIIYYGAIDTTTGILSSCLRAQFYTEAAAHNQGDKAQPVKYYAADNPFDTMQQILTDAGVAAGDIDTAAFDAEEAFCADLNVEAVISEPTKASDLYHELVDLLECKTWVSESQQITIARNLPNHPTRTYTALNDDANILADSCQVDLNQKSLITRCSIYWDWDLIGDIDDIASFNRLTVAVDTDAEGVNEYNETAEKIIKTRWLRHLTTGSTEEEQDSWIGAIAGRKVWQHRGPHPILQLDAELKDSALHTGQYAEITTDELQDVTGADIAAVNFQVVRRERKGDKLTLKCLRLTDRRVCYITPDDAPDFADATAAQKEIYGFIAAATGKMADFSEGYRIY